MHGRQLILAGLAMASLAGAQDASRSGKLPADARPPVAPTPAQAAWREFELGLVVPFGLGTFLEREAGSGRESPALFQPAACDPWQWARAATNAGARVLVVTAKAADGFCLWPSRCTEYTVAASPWQHGRGDVLHEAALACQAHGLGLGLRFSLIDRHEPAATRPPAYRRFVLRQLEELLTDYGLLAELWLDGVEEAGKAGVDLAAILQLARHLQPRMAVLSTQGPDGRLVSAQFSPTGDHAGSVRPAPPAGWWSAPGSAPGPVWQPLVRVASLRPSAYYRARENDRPASLNQLRELALRTLGRNSLLRLVAPADPTGQLPEADARRLAEFGAAWRRQFQRTLAMASGAARELVLELDPPREVGALAVREDIRRGERVRRFVLETRDPDETGWRVVADGRFPGHHWITEFQPRRLAGVRLRILDAAEPLSPLTLSVHPGP
ncbi:MAG: hypothetical protein D6766_13845 [Verrucomicrobia bacterium]|nr:MAG: hypothetical protein D6766_13845 [Verrucomicrobiota bacterium]